MIKHHFNIFVVTLLLVFLNPLSGFALTKEIADSCYRQGNYQQAISDYKALLRQAILNYERAYRLSPSDADVKFNLQFARSKTIDKITPESDNFFVALYRDVVTFANVDTWASWSIGSIVVALVLMLCYLFASPLWLRKTGFFGSAAFLAVFVFSTLFAWQQKYWLQHGCGAIVMSPSINVKATPEDKSPDAFVIHEGTRVDIIDDGLKGWKQVELGDGREGWIKSGMIEKI